MTTQTSAVQPTKCPLYAQTDSRLLGLAPELRNKIYRELLNVSTFEKPIRLVLSSHKNVSGRPPTVLSLLQTCRQILCEAEGIFYAINHIAIFWQLMLDPLCGDPFATIRLERIRTLTVLDASLQETERLARRWLHRMPELEVLTFDGVISGSPEAFYRMVTRSCPEAALRNLSRLRLIRHPGRPRVRHYEASDAERWCWELTGEEFQAFVARDGTEGTDASHRRKKGERVCTCAEGA